MTVEALNVINRLLTDAGINYEFFDWTSDFIYPYWVGEYSEVETLNEDGMSEDTFMLSGQTKGMPIELENDKQKIKELFPEISGNMVTTDSGSVVAIFYGNAIPVKNENSELKSMTINLKVKEWKVTQ